MTCMLMLASCITKVHLSTAPYYVPRIYLGTYLPAMTAVPELDPLLPSALRQAFQLSSQHLD